MTLRSQPSEGCASASFATSAHRTTSNIAWGTGLAMVNRDAVYLVFEESVSVSASLWRTFTPRGLSVKPMVCRTPLLPWKGLSVVFMRLFALCGFLRQLRTAAVVTAFAALTTNKANRIVR